MVGLLFVLILFFVRVLAYCIVAVFGVFYLLLDIISVVFCDGWYLLV